MFRSLRFLEPGQDLKFLAHNVLVHPLAGVMWFVGARLGRAGEHLAYAAERLHEIGAPPDGLP